MKQPAWEHATRHLRVWFAKRADLARVRDFYEQNQSSRINARDLEAILTTSELQRLYVIEETQDNQIVAAAACYAHCEGRFVELRDAVVRWKGYGLLGVLTHIRTIQSLVMTSSGVTVFCIADLARTRLRERLKRLGFTAWPDPPEELLSAMASGGYSPDAYMKFAAEEVEQHRQSLLELSRTGLLRHVATGDLASISLEILLNTDARFKRALEDSAPLP